MFSSTAHPSHEPRIVDILILSSFLLTRNVINSIVGGYLYNGLVGQILIGMGWGAPGTSCLFIPIHETVMQLWLSWSHLARLCRRF